jgi:DNA-binding NarL/FixJ family response regulator
VAGDAKIGNGVRAAICASDGRLAERLRAVLADGGVKTRAVVARHQALRKMDPLPDVVVLAVPGITPRAAALRKIRSALPATRVVAVAPESRGKEIRSAVEAGATGFVYEEEAAAALAPTVHAVLAGQVAVPYRERRQFEQPTLSAREKQILGLVVMGFMNVEIADKLFLAESTVKSHLSSAFAKLGVRSRNEAVDLILDGEDGLGRGILAITGSPAEVQPAAANAA